jgi:hypothetical protein
MTILAYAVCFLALATLTGLAAAGGPRWALRLPLIAATPVLALAVWWQLSQRDGWPTGSRPAAGSAFVAGVVEAPTLGSTGAVYLWTQPPGSRTPRSYRLPYSPELERQVARAASASKRGERVGVRAAGKPTGGKRPGGQARGSDLRFYRLPPRGLEEKQRSGST